MLEKTPITVMRKEYQSKADTILAKHLDDSILYIRSLTNEGCNIEEEVEIEVDYIKKWLFENAA